MKSEKLRASKRNSGRRTFFSLGFTMVELLVVMAIIGVLAAVIFANFTSARSRSRDAARKADLRQLKTALRLYFNDYQEYPDNDGQDRILGCGAAGTSACAWGGNFTAGSTQYMKQIPLDPLNLGAQIYTYNRDPLGVGDPDAYWLEATLENASDPDSAKSQQRCDPTNPVVALRYLVCED